MTASHSAVNQQFGRRLLLSVASIALLASGCSNYVNTSSTGNLVSTTGKIGGHVHGGNQPVSGATVNLYFAGQTGLAPSTPLTPVATTTTSNDGTGSFSFIKAADGGTNSGSNNTFSCPIHPGSPLVFVVARGGNTLNNQSSATNSASVFIAPYGLCANLNASSFVSMSEAVTVATVAAVHQYMNITTGNIGSDGINVAYDGLANSFKLVSNMVNLSTGQTIASTPTTGSAVGITVTSTPEQAKLNQVANILSACVNTPTGPAGSGNPPNACDVLFANAVPPPVPSATSTPNAAFVPATDVLQAAYYMFTNPSNTTPAHLLALYNLSPATGAPYQPTLTSLPSDWSIGIKYAAAGTCGTGGPSLISNPYDLNIDGNGNVWIANDQLGGSSLSELSPTGAPLACVPLAGASSGGTIDSAGNIWAGDFEHNMLYRYDPLGARPTLQFPVPAAPFALAADGAGNVYFSTRSAPIAVYEILGAASTSTPVVPLPISTDVGATPARILVDGNGAVWSSTRNSFVSLITPDAVTVPPAPTPTFTTTHVTTPTASYGLAVTYSSHGTNQLFVSIQDAANVMAQVTGSGTSYASSANFPTATGAAGLNFPSAIALDGAGSIWSANDSAATRIVGGTSTSFGVVSQISASGISLSPDANTANGIQTTGGYQKDVSSFLHGRAIAVDQSGNVWIGNDGSPAITEIVGAAVPIYQPFAVGLSNGRFQTIP